jgi:class 3 adenylate cyclase
VVNEAGPQGDGDTARVIELMRRLGATDADLAGTPGLRSYGDLALELVLRVAPPLTADDAATASGVTAEDFGLLWQVLGLPAIRTTDAVVPADLVDALPVVGEFSRTFLGDEVTIALARVVGSTTARLAEALVDAYRVQFEVPRLLSGDSYEQVVERQVEFTQAGIHAFEKFMTAAFRAHLVRVASGTWAPDEESGATRRELFVGFADLVGYTALTRTMTMGELAHLLSQFEGTVGDVVGAHGGRLVKLIGDGAMFVADSAAAGCAIALAICEQLGESTVLPPARVGGDSGKVLSLHGDYFGDVVNRAARLVALANPGTVVVSEDVARSAGAGYAFEQLPAQALKGFHVPAVSFRLRTG